MKRTLFILFSLAFVSPTDNEIEAESLSDNPLAAYKQLYTQSASLYEEAPDEGLPIAEEALEYAYLADSALAIAKAQFLVAKTAYKVDDYRLAFEMFSLAKEGYEDLGKQIYVGWCYFNLAVIYNEAAKYEEAKHLHNSALALLQGNVSDTDLAKLLRGRGLIYIKENNFELAISEYTRALALAPEDKTNLSVSHFRLGYCYRELSEREQAQYHYYQSYQASNNIGALYETNAASANQLAFYALQDNEPHDALAYASEALGVLKDKWHSFDLENKLVNKLASSYFSIGQPDKAYEVITKLLSKPECEQASQEILYTYELLIYEYLKPKGDTEALAQAEAERYAHRERLEEEKKDVSALAAAGVATAETTLYASEVEAQIEAVKYYGSLVLAVLLVVGVLWQLIIAPIRKQKRERDLNELKDELTKRRAHLLRVSRAMAGYPDDSSPS